MQMYIFKSEKNYSWVVIKVHFFVFDVFVHQNEGAKVRFLNKLELKIVYLRYNF